MFLLTLTLLIGLLFFCFSYYWIDFSLVNMLVQSKPTLAWLYAIRDYRFAYRSEFAYLFLALIIVLVIIQLFWLIRSNRLVINRRFWVISTIIVIIFGLCYPFLSRDIFSYLFGTKILYCFHHNPYTVPPLAFQATDLWLGFTHNVEKTYAYGPVYILYTLVPFLLFSCDKFISLFFSLKVMNGLLFVISGWLIWEITRDKRFISLWLFNPFLLLELLANSHNELVMVSLLFCAFYLIKNKTKIFANSLFALSIITKFISIFFLPLFLYKKLWSESYFKLMVLLLTLFVLFRGNMPWYYIWVYMALPFANLKTTSLVLVYLTQLVLIITKYYGFVLSDTWQYLGIFSRLYWLVYPLIITIVAIELFYPIKRILKINKHERI